jgi:hypothetical protein
MRSLGLMNEKGQEYAVFKLLQGAILAVLVLGIVYALLIVVYEEFYIVGPFRITIEILGDAYSAGGTGHMFSRQARTVDEEFDGKAVEERTALPVSVELECGSSISGVCESGGGNTVKFKKGSQIWVCACCSTTDCTVTYANDCEGVPC